MKYLCDNPSCRLHLPVELRSHAPGLAPEWSYTTGFRGSVDKELVHGFDPDAERNFCKACTNAFKLGQHEPEEAHA